MIYSKPVITAIVTTGLAGFIFFQMHPLNAEGKSFTQAVCNENSVPVTSPCVTGTEIKSEFSFTEPATTSSPVTELSTVISTAVTTTCTTVEISEVTAETTADTEPETTENIIQGVICGEMLQGVDYTEYQLPDNPDYHGFKSYEPYDLITAQSVQLCLQQEANTDVNGFRLLDGRYLVAVGTFCNAPCGTYVDLILENGILIPCIVGDIKADVHTDETNTYTMATMCASEFIVDESICPAAWYGDVSMVYEEWRDKVVMVRIY